MDDRKDPNQGEGDRISARRYDRHVRKFVRDGKVWPAAHEAEQFVEQDPRAAARAERTARRGPHGYLGLVQRAIGIGWGLLERVRSALHGLRRPTAANRSR
jgi:hypothetical protein